MICRDCIHYDLSTETIDTHGIAHAKCIMEKCWVCALCPVCKQASLNDEHNRLVVGNREERQCHDMVT